MSYILFLVVVSVLPQYTSWRLLSKEISIRLSSGQVHTIFAASMATAQYLSNREMGVDIGRATTRAHPYYTANRPAKAVYGRGRGGCGCGDGALVANTSHLSQKGGKRRQESSHLADCQKAENKKPGAFDVQMTRNGNR